MKKRSPDKGLEPLTLRSLTAYALKVWCSTDWANRALDHDGEVIWYGSSLKAATNPRNAKANITPLHSEFPREDWR